MWYEPKPHLLHFEQLHTAWVNLVQTVGLRFDVSTAIANIVGPTRHYHSWQHCARMWDTWLGLPHDKALDAPVAIAILFHDSVYVAGAKSGDNEAKSAELLRKSARRDDDNTKLAIEMTLATGNHWQEDWSLAQRIFCDLDLFGLSFRFDEFTYNGVLIRREFADVPTEEFVIEQAKLYRTWLNYKNIYNGDWLPAWCEMSARENLHRAVELLNDRSAPWVFKE